jgi:hypothetical protein
MTDCRNQRSLGFTADGPEVFGSLAAGTVRRESL